MEERRGGCVLGGRHRVRQPPRPDRDGRPEDVARLKLPAVDPETSRDVIDSPPRLERVQRIAQPLQVGGRRLRHHIDVQGAQGNALKAAGKASKHDVLIVVGVEHIAERLYEARLLIGSGVSDGPPADRFTVRTASIRAQ